MCPHDANEITPRFVIFITIRNFTCPITFPNWLVYEHLIPNSVSEKPRLRTLLPPAPCSGSSGGHLPTMRERLIILACPLKRFIGGEDSAYVQRESRANGYIIRGGRGGRYDRKTAAPLRDPSRSCGRSRARFSSFRPRPFRSPRPLDPEVDAACRNTRVDNIFRVYSRQFSRGGVALIAVVHRGLASAFPPSSLLLPLLLRRCSFFPFRLSFAFLFFLPFVSFLHYYHY